MLAETRNPRLFAERITKHFRTHPGWITPFVETTRSLDNCSAVYPEITSENLIGATSVIRWFLHYPGFFNGRAEFGKGEIDFRHRSSVTDFIVNRSMMSSQLPRAFYFPSDPYYTEEVAERVLDCCHMIRKRKYKPHVHSSGSVLLDGKTHAEIWQIFKRSERFISYDDYTAYSKLAACFGCESVVVPSPNTTPEQWRPSIEDRYGVAYGTSPNQLEWTRKTQRQTAEAFQQAELDSIDSVRRCLAEAIEFFNESHHNRKPTAKR
ncbi:WavQ protein [Rhodopirellula baltica SH28]|uniref:WavQ protein n=1 Tax=Rhodopirellula baltica SH28 TaxID=993517 RepID=K5DZ68_RHOBT|nr:WavQ protein [Rhodopirellula baltica SH28]